MSFPSLKDQQPPLVQIHKNPKQNNTQRVSLSCTDTVLKITFCTQLTNKAKKLTNPKYEL